MANHYISGVNWSSLKKFAEFHFEGFYKTAQIIGKEYFIFLDEDFYNSEFEEVVRFEKRFLVNIRPFK